MKKSIFIITITCCIIAFSCSEDLLTKENKNAQTTETFFKNTAELKSGVTGVYAILQSPDLYSRERFFLHDLRSDDMASGGGGLGAGFNQILNGSFDVANGTVGANWRGLYRLVHRANAIIAYGPEATVTDAAIHNRLIAEAKFLRALAYFDLYTQWGGVPLYTTFAASLDGASPRASVDEVKDLIIQDLTEAIEILPNSYSDADRGRVRKIAAQTLLGKLYLFDGDYDLAKVQLDAVRTYGETTFAGNPLMDLYFANFTEEDEFNKESIWEIVFNSSGGYNWNGDGNGSGPTESWIRSQEYSAIGWRNLIPSDKLLAEYEVNDPRLNDNFYFVGDEYGAPGARKVLTADVQGGNTSNFRGEVTKVSWKKYSVMYKLDPGSYYEQIGVNFRVMRYADVYLMLAEIENEVGSAALAIDYLNKTRQRPSVNMPLYPTTDYPTGTKDQILRAIMHERMVELAGEEIRNFDILRWRKNGKFGANTQPEPLSYFVAPKFQLLPIPLSELDANPNIDQADQNPGY